MNIKAFIKSNKAFFIPATVFLLVGIFFLVLFPKEVIHITQNGWYNPFFDVFFAYLTHLGDGLIIPIGIILLVFYKWRYAIGMAISGLLTLFLAGFLKKVVFKGTLRPIKFFEDFPELKLRLIEGVSMHSWNSFPSGHTMAAFAFWGLLAFIAPKPYLKLIFCFIAIGVGYSRIYLSQHFLEDVVAGACIGILVAFIAFFVAQMFKPSWADKRVQRNNT